MSKKWLPHFYLLSVNILYGAGFTIAKEIMPAYVKPFGMIGVRVGSAALFFTIYNLFRGFEKIDRRDLPRMMACGLFGIALNQLCFFEGLSLTTPINAALIMTTTPIMVIMISFMSRTEKMSGLKILGALLGLTGAILLIINGKSIGSMNIGDIFILFNAMSYAIYLVIVKPLMSKYTGFTVVMYAFLFGAVLVAPVSWSQLNEAHWSQLPPHIWAAIIYVVLGITIIAYLFNILAIKVSSSSLAGIYIFAQPVFASINALIFGKDSFSLIKLISMLLVFSGVFLVSRTFEFRSSQLNNNRHA